MSTSWAKGSTRAWRRLRRHVLERDGYACQLPADHDPAVKCLALATHADHVIPKSAGGPDTAANLRAACARHNLSRGAGQALGRRRAGQARRRAGRSWSW